MLVALESWLSGRVSAGPVAITRIALGLALGIVTLESAAILHDIASGALAYPFFPWVPRPTELAAPTILVLGWLAATGLVLGLLPDLMARIGAATGLLTLTWDQQTYSSHLVLITILLTLLSFAESDRRWALSRRRYAMVDGVPFWPQLLMLTQVSAVYLFAGLSKAQPTFLSGKPLADWMWLALPSWAYVILAGLTVLTEVALAIALWVPYLRVGATIVGVSLHLSIVLLLKDQAPWLIGFALTTTATYPLFLTRPALRGLLPSRAVTELSKTT